MSLKRLIVTLMKPRSEKTEFDFVSSQLGRATAFACRWHVSTLCLFNQTCHYCKVCLRARMLERIGGAKTPGIIAPKQTRSVDGPS